MWPSLGVIVQDLVKIDSNSTLQNSESKFGWWEGNFDPSASQQKLEEMFPIELWRLFGSCQLFYIDLAAGFKCRTSAFSSERRSTSEQIHRQLQFLRLSLTPKLANVIIVMHASPD